MAKICNRYERRKARTRQSLMDAARELISEKGYSNVEIVDITQRANLSRATFYKHFKNKEDCVWHLMQQGFDALVAELLSTRRPDAEPQEWFRRSTIDVYRWAQDNRELLLVMVGGSVSPNLNIYGRDYMVQIVERLITTDLAQDVALLGNPDYPPIVKAHAVSGIFIHLLGWWLENDTSYSAEAMGTMTHNIIRSGVGFPEDPTESIDR